MRDRVSVVGNQTTRAKIPLLNPDSELHRRQLATRLNAAMMDDGTEPMKAPLILKSYAVADLPTASDWESAIAYCSDETGGATIVFSDGTNWRRVTDRAVAS